ncbi:hypothetical protein MKZ38_008056 [Zalerion maritima]|uniref:Uncharacterized protein n=1 Tax=Zalerion maritima TaxID=339359 RepID=A0AAD5WNV2_9PEZI|nr:hypothetical protein MKZ38_008056 [Zalerion maritima]
MEQKSIGDDDGSSAPDWMPQAQGEGERGPSRPVLHIQKLRYKCRPALAIEYKAPHKRMRDELVTGRQSEIWSERDVINQNDEGFVFASRLFAAAIVTQLFAHMIRKDIQYGYSWHNKARSLGTWAVEYDEPLANRLARSAEKTTPSTVASTRRKQARRGGGRRQGQGKQ